jgi:phosphohistidine phosphatase SixA
MNWNIPMKPSLSLLVAVGLASLCLRAWAQPAGESHQHPHHAAAANPHGHASPLHAPPQVYLLTEQLRQGGLVIFLRHAKTAHDGIDQAPFAADDCARQRNLGRAGRLLSEEMGDAFKTLGIRVGLVLASPWCRTMETARMAFGRAQAEPALAIDVTRMNATVDHFWRLSNRVPEPGANTVLVGHLLSTLMALGLKIDEGEAIVMRPGAVKPEVLGRINAVQWGDLTRDWRAHAEQVFAYARTEMHTQGGHGAPPHAVPKPGPLHAPHGMSPRP